MHTVNALQMSHRGISSGSEYANHRGVVFVKLGLVAFSQHTIAQIQHGQEFVQNAMIASHNKNLAEVEADGFNSRSKLSKAWGIEKQRMKD